MSLEFQGIAVNPHAHPGEAIVKELEWRIIYQLNEILDTPNEIDKVEWILSFNYGYTLNIEWVDGAIELTPTGEIVHETWSSGSKPPLYVILYDDNFVPPGCVAVEKIEKPFNLFQLWQIHLLYLN